MAWMGRRVVCLCLTLVPLASSTCESTTNCTAIGCPPLFEVAVRSDTDGRFAGVETIVRFDSDDGSLEVTCDAAGACTGTGDLTTGDFGVSDGFVRFSVLAYDVAPETLEATVTIDGDVVLTETLTPDYVVGDDPGEGCGDPCRSADLELTVPAP